MSSRRNTRYGPCSAPSIWLCADPRLVLGGGCQPMPGRGALPALPKGRDKGDSCQCRQANRNSFPAMPTGRWPRPSRGACPCIAACRCHWWMPGWNASTMARSSSRCSRMSAARTCSSSSRPRKPANDNLMELLIMADALRRSSAARVTAVNPLFRLRAPGPAHEGAHADLGQARVEHDYPWRGRAGP